MRKVGIDQESNQEIGNRLKWLHFLVDITYF